MFRLSISNIAWTEESDQRIYRKMKDLGFSGLEIAPTRIFLKEPYDHIEDAKVWVKKLSEEYGLVIPSMQSIWYGKKDNIFGAEEERDELICYTKKAIDFAETIGCKNLVFGCPKNRNIPDGINEEVADKVAIGFFKTIGNHAHLHHTVIGMEATSAAYNTNYINSTTEAIGLIKRVSSPGFKLNLDIGTMIYNGEDISILMNNIGLINHVHISEPGLKEIKKREIHKELKNLLMNCYENYISIEMMKDSGIERVEESMKYVSELFL